MSAARSFASYLAGSILLSGGLMSGCASKAPDNDVVLTTVDTLLPAANTILARPIELVLGDDGLLYLADAGLNQVVVLDGAGRFQRAIGREGSGPGELRVPGSVSVSHDTVRLVDSGNGRLSYFTVAGQFVRTEPAPPGALLGALSFDSAGPALVARHGFEGALAQRIKPDRTLGSKVGTPVVPVAEFWDFSHIKAELTAGRVPAELRSQTIPVLDREGGVWLVLFEEGLIERYTRSDSLIWRVPLEDTTLGAIRASAIRRNRADSIPNRFHTFSYVVDARSSHQSLWVLLGQPDETPARFLVYDVTGTVRWRISIPGATNIRGFALNEETGELYLLDGAQAALLRVARPPGMRDGADG